MNIIKDTKKYFLTPVGGNSKNQTYKSELVYDIPGIIKDETYILYNTISISHAEIPYSFYIVNVYNNLLSLSTGDIYIDRGNYNATSLLKHINTKLPTNLVLSFNSQTGKFKFTYNQSFSINATTTLYEVLGLEKNKKYNSVNNIIECEYPANLLGSKNLYIKSNISTSNYNSETKDYNTLCCIPIQSEPYGIILYNNYSATSHIIKDKTLDSIEIRIYDDDQNLINFNNVDWSITLEITSYIARDFSTAKSIEDYLNNI